MFRYNNIAVETADDGTKYRANALFPEIEPTDEDIYLMSTAGDRYDRLAYDYYSNTSYWWIIAVANADVRADSLAIEPGTQIRIPSNPEGYIEKYEELNS